MPKMEEMSVRGRITKRENQRVSKKKKTNELKNEKRKLVAKALIFFITALV
jgi:hypothetical protein